MIAHQPAFPKRLAARLLLAALLALGLAAPATASREARAELRFDFVPARGAQGELVSVSAAVQPASARCSLTVRYANGATQAALDRVKSPPGQVAWRWRIPARAATGPASVTASCAQVGRLSRVVRVVEPAPLPAPVIVEKQGFSQRANAYSPGSSVSYGLVLGSPSKKQDVVGLKVLVNFVDANDVVLQSATANVARIAAGSEFFLGGSASLSTVTPVVRLEVVLQDGTYAPSSLQTPAVSNVRVSASPYDKGYVGSVDGQVLNGNPSEVMSGALLTVVLFDAKGNVIGGGSGYASASLPTGAREYFSATSGFSPVPVDRAAAARVTVQPTFRPASPAA